MAATGGHQLMQFLLFTTSSRDYPLGQRRKLRPEMLPSPRSHSEARRHESSAMGPQSSLLLRAKSSSSAKTTGHNYGPGGPAGSWKAFPVREKSSLNIHRAKDITHLPHVTKGNMTNDRKTCQTS